MCVRYNSLNPLNIYAWPSFSVCLNAILLGPVLRIHDILVWIRIRIRGSTPDNGPDPSISSLTYKMQQKTNLKKSFFCILLFEGTYTSFSKYKKSKRSHNTVGIRFFLILFLLNDRRIRIRIYRVGKNKCFFFVFFWVFEVFFFFFGVF